MTIYQSKILAGIISGFVAVFVQNLLPLFVTVTVFEVIDFVTGVIKSAVVAKRSKQKFAFESVKAWRTIYKYILILIGIVLAEMLDQTIDNETRLRFANYFTGFCCGVEFWSFLENAAVISDHPIFRWLRRFMKFKVEDQIGMPFDDAIKQAEEKAATEKICAECKYNVAGDCVLKMKDVDKCPIVKHRKNETRKD